MASSRTSAAAALASRQRREVERFQPMRNLVDAHDVPFTHAAPVKTQRRSRALKLTRLGLRLWGQLISKGCAIVTGGAGFIGSHVVDALLAEDCT